MNQHDKRRNLILVPLEIVIIIGFGRTGVIETSHRIAASHKSTKITLPISSSLLSVIARPYYIACDNLGSPKLISDSSGNITKALEYDSYGRITADSNPGFTIAIGYAGGLNDHNGLIRFGARDYDPDTGRWTAKDPLLFEGGQGNLYAYVANDPVNKTDPEGTFAIVLVPVAIELSGEAIAVIAGFATAVIMAANKDSITEAAKFTKSKDKSEKENKLRGAEHTKGARKSTQPKHEKGQQRKKMDQGGEKGDKRRNISSRRRH